MAVAFQTASESATYANASGDFTVTKPSGTVEGDLLIAICYQENSSGFTPPSGFTTIRDRTTSLKMWSGYKIATGSEPASYTFNTSQSAFRAAHILRIDGHDAATPIATSAIDYQEGISSATDLSLSVTPTNANSMLVYSLRCYPASSGLDLSGYGVTTSNPTWTERSSVEGGESNTSAVATAIRPEITATGDAQWSGGDESQNVNGVMIVVNEAQAAGPATLKTANTVATASVKTRNGVAIASVKTWDTAA